MLNIILLDIKIINTTAIFFLSHAFISNFFSTAIFFYDEYDLVFDKYDFFHDKYDLFCNKYDLFYDKYMIYFMINMIYFSVTCHYICFKLQKTKVFTR